MVAAVPRLFKPDCEVVTDFARLESMAGEWRGLWNASPHSEIFQNFGWARAFWKSSGSHLSLFAPVVYRGPEIIGILPLALSGDTLQFLGTPLSDYNDVICADECVTDVMDAAIGALLRAPESWKAAVLDNVPAHSRFAGYVASLQPAARKNFRSAFRSPCPTIMLGDEGELVDKLVRKQSLRRHENALRKLGQLTFRHSEDRQEIAEHLDGFFRQHIARRAMAGQISHFLEKRTCSMFAALVNELDPRTLLRFAILAIDGRPVAYHFGFEAKGKFIFYQPTFDIDYLRYSPGEVLLRHLLLYARDRKLAEFDFTSGGEAYKDRFATRIRGNLTLYLNHDLGLRRSMQVSIQRAEGTGRRVLESLRKYPRAYRFAGSAIVRFLNWWRLERRLMQYLGTKYRDDAIRRIVRNFIFHGRKTVTFSIPKEDVEFLAGAPAEGLSVDRATLSEMALIWAAHPVIMAPLREFQERLAAGQEIFVVRQHTQPVQIWCANPESEAAAEAQADKRALMLEQRWTATGFHAGGFFRGLLQQVSDRHMDVLVSCEGKSPVSRELRGVGFSALRHAIHLRLLYWFRPVFVGRATSS